MVPETHLSADPFCNPENALLGQSINDITSLVIEYHHWYIMVSANIADA